MSLLNSISLTRLQIIRTHQIYCICILQVLYKLSKKNGNLCPCGRDLGELSARLSGCVSGWGQCHLGERSGKILLRRAACPPQLHGALPVGVEERALYDHSQAARTVPRSHGRNLTTKSNKWNTVLPTLTFGTTLRKVSAGFWRTRIGRLMITLARWTSSPELNNIEIWLVI